MKKFLIPIFSVVLLLGVVISVIALTKPEEKTFEDYLYEEDGFTFHEQITMSVPDTLTAGVTTLPYVVTNNSETDIFFHGEIELQIKKDGEWERALPPISINEDGETYVVRLDRYVHQPYKCQKQSDVTVNQPLNTRDNIALYGPLVCGEYRLIKTACTSPCNLCGRWFSGEKADTVDSHTFDLVAYFTVTEAPAE